MLRRTDAAANDLYQKLEAAGGLAKADEAQIATAVQDAALDVAGVWESERAVPPAVIWRRTLDDARLLTSRALTYGDEHLPDARSFDIRILGSDINAHVIATGREALYPAEEVAEAPKQGFSAPEIGEKLYISPKTVDTYKQRINEKLGLAHRSDYVQLALKLGLLEQT